MLDDSILAIDKWLQANAPQIKNSLQAPVSDKTIAELQSKIGTVLPGDLIKLYKTHNGNDPAVIANFFYGITFVPLEQTMKTAVSAMQRKRKDQLRYTDPEIHREYMFSSHRLAIGDDYGTSLLCVDLAPGPDGKIGQVIYIDYENQVALKVAESVEQLLRRFAADLEHGKYQLNADALQDGKQWLQPDISIDLVNWRQSPTWKHIKV